jgi:cyclomaltodextrin glucanotransferase
MREFRGETVYFILIDRFCDGDPQNDTGKDAASYDPTHTRWYHYWGGDLLGVISKLDYLHQMGVTAIWLTPLFDQVDALVQMAEPMTGYHGYWAKDFKRLDEHLVENPEDVRLFARDDTIFDRLVKELRARGMSLLLDVVCNHSNPNVIGSCGELYDDGRKLASYHQDKDAWYHHAGEVKNWKDLNEVQAKTFAGLSDFNEESHAFRSYIKGAIMKWLDRGGDGLRVDTVKHMPLWFWQEFTGDILAHKPDAFLFGEWFLGGVYDADAVEFANHSGMSMIDFALHFAVTNSLARDKSFAEIADVLSKDGRYRAATELMTFVDNHDLPRFLSVRNDAARLRMAVDFIMTARGIPILYYGTEQCLHNDTNGGEDPYNRPMMESWDQDTPIYRDVKTLAELRRKNLAVQKGATHTRHLDDDVYVFERTYMGHICLVAMNKGPSMMLKLDALQLPDGSYQNLLGKEVLSVERGRARVTLASDSVQVFHHTLPIPVSRAAATLQLRGCKAETELVHVTGDCLELGDWVVARAPRLERIDANTWSVDVAFYESAGKPIRYKYFLLGADGKVLRENHLGHYHSVPASGHVSWHDDW